MRSGAIIDVGVAGFADSYPEEPDVLIRLCQHRRIDSL